MSTSSNAAKRKWEKENPERAKISKRREKFKSRYGITIEQYDEMVFQREGRCDICHRIPTGKGSASRLNVDHDHKTKKIRGLLCWQCNIAMGYLGDSLENIQSALEYLSK